MKPLEKRRSHQLCLENASSFKPWGVGERKLKLWVLWKTVQTCPRAEPQILSENLFLSMCLSFYMPLRMSTKREPLTFWFCTFLCETMNCLSTEACFKLIKSSNASVITVIDAFFSYIAEWLCKLTISVIYLNEFKKCNKHQNNEKILGKIENLLSYLIPMSLHFQEQMFVRKTLTVID